MRVLVDCDGVLADFVGCVLDWMRERGDPRTGESITDFNIFKAWGCPELWPDFNKHVSQKGVCHSLAVLDGAVPLVAAMRDLGCELVVATSPYKNAPHWIPERLQWLGDHFGFSLGDVCPWERKHWIRADVLIDDALHNAESFAEAGGRVLLLDQPWNQSDKPLPEGVTRCHGYSEVIAELMGLSVTDPLPPPRWDDPVPFSCTSLADALPRVSEKSPSIVNPSFGRIDVAPEGYNVED